MWEHAGHKRSNALVTMLWILLSLACLYCVFREVASSIVAPPGFDLPRPIYKPYLVTMVVLAALFAWPPLHRWHFERFLSERATELADNHPARVHCSTLFDTIFDPEVLAAGHADPRTGKIVIQPPGCSILSSYLRHPERASEHELWSLGLFTHESMHVRGELDEARTECEAVQRNYRAAKLLGVPDRIAKENALEYYRVIYRRRGQLGPMQAQYYSGECAPGKGMDEHLSDSTWVDS
jgi:hypothetical protein